MAVTLKDALKSKMKNMKIAQQLKEIQALALWKDTVGPHLTGQTNATKLIRGTLFVTVTSPAWAHQLSYFRKQYIEKMNDRIGEPLIKDIFFQVGNIDIKEEKDTEEVEISHTDPSVALDDLEQGQINAGSAGIENEALQNAFRRIMEKDYLSRKLKYRKGWGKCKICGAPCPPAEEYCWFCNQGQETGRKSSLLRWFQETPWLDFREANKLIPELKKEEFENVRIMALQEQKREISKLLTETTTGPKAQIGQDLRQKALAYVMLKKGLTPDKLDHHILEETLTSEIYNRIFST